MEQPEQAAEKRKGKGSSKPRKGHVLAELFAEPDLVDRIFDYILELHPAMRDDPRLTEVKAATRAEFRGEETYILNRSRTDRQQQVAEVLRMFNGRNASEVARRLQISRATVYRVLKQAAR